MKYPQKINWSHRIFAGYFCIFTLNLKILTPVLAKGNLENETNNLGWISPNNEVLRGIGQALNVSCTINLEYAQDFSSTNLNFIQDGKFITAQNLSLNETTISMYLSNAAASDHFYECVLIKNKTSESRHESDMVSIGTVRIVVGETPKAVQQFRCILHHSSILKCHWKQPEYSAPANYTVHFVPLTNSEGMASNCPNDDDRRISSCEWSLKTFPPYYNSYKLLNVTLIGENRFGKVEGHFIFNQSKHSRPEPPSNVTMIEDPSNNHTIELQWYMDYTQHNRTDFLYHINIYSGATSSSTKYNFSSENVTKVGDNFTFFINNVKPNIGYAATVSVSLLSAPPYVDYWSDPIRHRIHSNPLPATYVPDPAKLFFWIREQNTSFRRVNIYWPKMLYKEEYGNFHHVIDVSKIDETGMEWPAPNVSLHSKHKLLSEAEYTIDHSCYRFDIRSANYRGKSPNASSIFVPATNRTVQIPVRLYLTEIRGKNQSGWKSYNCTWKLPDEQFSVMSYTIFWYKYYTDSCGYKVEDEKKDSIVLMAPENSTIIQIQSDGNLHDHWGITISVNMKNNQTGLQFPASHVFSITDLSRQFFKEKQKPAKSRNSSNTSPKSVPVDRPERLTYNGLKFSEDQFQKWMSKLDGV